MKRIRNAVVCSVGVPVFAALLGALAFPGCSNDSTLVAEGDPEVRRKNKDEDLGKMLNPHGASAPAPKRKAKNSGPELPTSL